MTPLSFMIGWESCASRLFCPTLLVREFHLKTVTMDQAIASIHNIWWWWRWRRRRKKIYPFDVSVFFLPSQVYAWIIIIIREKWEETYAVELIHPRRYINFRIFILYGNAMYTPRARERHTISLLCGTVRLTDKVRRHTSTLFMRCFRCSRAYRTQQKETIFRGWRVVWMSKKNGKKK